MVFHFLVVPLITGGPTISLKGWFKGFVSMASFPLQISMSLWGGSHGLGLWTHDYYRSDLCWSMLPPEAVKKGTSRGIGKGTLIAFFFGDSTVFFSILTVLCKSQDIVFLLFSWQSLSPINNWYISVLDTKSVIWRTSPFTLVVTCLGKPSFCCWKKKKFQDPGFDQKPTLIPNHVLLFPKQNKNNTADIDDRKGTMELSDMFDLQRVRCQDCSMARGRKFTKSWKRFVSHFFPAPRNLFKFEDPGTQFVKSKHGIFSLFFSQEKGERWKGRCNQLTFDRGRFQKITMLRWWFCFF